MPSNSKPLDWLKGTPFSWCQEEDVIYVLNKEINSEQAPGFTYKMYALSIALEEPMAHRAYAQGASSYRELITPLAKFLFPSIWSVAEWPTETVLSSICPIAGLGVYSILMAYNVYSWRNIVNDILKTVGYNQALGYYFFLRGGTEAGPEAWDDVGVVDLIKRTIPSGTSDYEQTQILDNTKNYFEKLWNTYGQHGRTTYGLDDSYRKQARTDLKNVIISALEKYQSELPNRGRYKVNSPVELRVYDSEGHVTGLVDGKIVEEIPASIYDKEQEEVLTFNSSDSYSCLIKGTSTGHYGLSVSLVKNGNESTFNASEIPILPGAINRYIFNWSALSQGENGTTIQIDNNGDGKFEQNITTNSVYVPINNGNPSSKGIPGFQLTYIFIALFLILLLNRKRLIKS